MLNPLNKEQSMIFNNENYQKYLPNIIKLVGRFTASYFNDQSISLLTKSSDFALRFPSISDLMSKVKYPSELDEGNDIKIPTNVLYFLLF